jgi:hypothetical protein
MSKYIDERNQYRTKSLFREEISRQVREAGYKPVFTLKDYDYEDQDGTPLPSLKKIYMAFEDPTEYEFAIATFESWPHWEHLCSVTWFNEIVQKWRDEMEVAMRSKAVKAIMKTAIDEGNKGTNAAKYIAERGWEKRAGRPTKAQVKKEAKVQAGIREEVEEDAKRLDLH